MAQIETDCRKCECCLPHRDRCYLYGSNPDIAVSKCAQDGFASYKPSTDSHRCGTCDYWEDAYSECSHSDKPQGEAVCLNPWDGHDCPLYKERSET